MLSILMGVEMDGVSPSVVFRYFLSPRVSSSNPMGSQNILTSDILDNSQFILIKFSDDLVLEYIFSKMNADQMD